MTPGLQCTCRACDLGLHLMHLCAKPAKWYIRVSDGSLELLCVTCAHADLMADLIEEVET